MIRIASDRLTAEISPLGAELQSLRDTRGREYLWDGDAAWWTGRAPILFPIVGSLADDALRVNGETFTMPKHGFARRSTFAVIEDGYDYATFRLEANETTRAAYPFDFTLDIAFELAGATLSVTATLTNTDDVALPASFGFHPAFRWPLPDAGARDEYRLRFAEEEAGPIRRIDGSGLVTPTLHDTPVEGRNLALADALFDEDALIFEAPNSRSVRFGAPGEPGLEIGWENLPSLGIWTKPGGAPFLCIEPWQGHSDPEGFTGAFPDKPGVIEVAPEKSRTFKLTVTVEAA